MNNYPRPPSGTQPCKVGTIPSLVVFDKRGHFEIGRKIRLRFAGHGEKWFDGILRNIEPIRVDHA
jgi:hypothetical protein